MDDDLDFRQILYFSSCIMRDGFMEDTDDYWLQVNQYWEMYKALGIDKHIKPKPRECEEIRETCIELEKLGFVLEMNNLRCQRHITMSYLVR